jgi:hypothetical protein
VIGLSKSVSADLCAVNERIGDYALTEAAKGKSVGGYLAPCWSDGRSKPVATDLRYRSEKTTGRQRTRFLHKKRGKDAFGLEALTRSHFTAPRRRSNSPTEVCTGAARMKEQSQRRVSSLIPTMVFNDRSTYKDRHARNSSWPGEIISAQRPNTFAQTCLLGPNSPCSPAADHTLSEVIRSKVW